jgi:hypothetical protein
MAVNIDKPQFGIAVQPDQEGKLFMSLIISTSGTTYQSFLCRSENYADTARQIHDKIMEAGKEMRRAESGIVAVNGSLDGIVPKAKGRK